MKHSITTQFHPMKIILPLLAIALLSLAVVAHAASTPSVLQFRLVVDNPTADSEQMTIVQPNNSSRQPEVLNVQKEVLLDNSVVRNAAVVADGRGNPEINVKLTDDGAKRFAEVTRQNIGKRLAIVIDGKTYMAPRINSEIPSGEAIISGAFTKAEAENLAARIIGSPVQVHKSLNWSRIGFYCFAGLFAAATGIVVWMAIRRKDRPPAA